MANCLCLAKHFVIASLVRSIFKKQQGCNRLPSLHFAVAAELQQASTVTGAHVSMNLLFLLPLVSPRSRARDPVAVTDDGLVHRQHHPVLLSRTASEKIVTQASWPRRALGAKNGTTFVLRRNHQFVHIPKCGGSTIERFLRLPFQGHREMHHGGPWGQARPIVV